MKIISPGSNKKAPLWYYGFKVMCPNCKAILEIEAKDSIVELLGTDNSTVTAARVTCACCHQHLTIEPGKSLP